MKPRLFPWVQALRAIAAASVAFAHIAHDAITAGRDPNGVIDAVFRAMPWTAGVDIFFVISGFVIVHASAGLFAQPGGWHRFLRRRLTRIVPLYWALTTLFLLILVLQRAAIHGATGGAGYVIASYLFLPWPRPDGSLQPALGLGWTLNYEMFFYAVLTPFLLLPRPAAVAGAAALLFLLVAIGQTIGFNILALEFWSNPIVLEFVLGMGLALAVAAGLSLPLWARLGMVAAAVVCLHLTASAWDIFIYGLSGALLVTACVSSRRPERIGPAMRVLIRLGDASYAMYLFHPFVMRGFTLLEAHLGAKTEASGVLYVAVSLVTAQLCALAINAGFERRITNLLRNRSQVSPGGTSSAGSSC